jgi:hypothetical protein
LAVRVAETISRNRNARRNSERRVGYAPVLGNDLELLTRANPDHDLLNLS